MNICLTVFSVDLEAGQGGDCFSNAIALAASRLGQVLGIKPLPFHEHYVTAGGFILRIGDHFWDVSPELQAYAYAIDSGQEVKPSEFLLTRHVTALPRPKFRLLPQSQPLTPCRPELMPSS